MTSPIHAGAPASQSRQAPLGVEAEVASLETLDLAGLRRAWEGRCGPPPRLRSTGLLRLMLAWRIQADAHGGLDGAALRALRGANRLGLRERLAVGDRISREYRGVRHEVEMTAEGYRHGDKLYPSLSAVAREITGTKWNGWRFFGLPTR